MAQRVAFNLAGKVLELLSPLIHEEIKLACGVKAELENLKSTVSIIKDVLLDAEKKADDSVAVKVGSKSSRMSSMMLMTCWMISPLKLCNAKQNDDWK